MPGLGFQLPDPGEYGVGMMFLPRRSQAAPAVRKNRRAKSSPRKARSCLGWRKVPTDNLYLGDTAKACEPFVRQVFIGRGAGITDDLAFERKLYVIRRRAENAIRYAGLPAASFSTCPSLSCRTIIYKGHADAATGGDFYPDLSDPMMETAIAVVHSRFSTNTFPELGTRASVSLSDPQRRDQHTARQRELDARAAGDAGLGAVRR